MPQIMIKFIIVSFSGDALMIQPNPTQHYKTLYNFIQIIIRMLVWLEPAYGDGDGIVTIHYI